MLNAICKAIIRINSGWLGIYGLRIVAVSLFHFDNDIQIKAWT